MGISLGIVGLGSFGSAFADLFKNHPLVDRIALCDNDPDKVAKFAGKASFQDKFDPKDAYASLDEICQSDLDALAIITQPWLHAPQAIQALESGKHDYTAVPIISVPDSDEILDWCDKLVETVRRTGMRFMMGETTYYRPEAMLCRRKAEEGAFGQFVYAEGEYFHDVDSPSCNLRDVKRHRLASRAGKEWVETAEAYRKRGVLNGPMHYPTHSTGGPISVMKAHAVKACSWGFTPPKDDDFFDGYEFSNETALFQMSNGATMRICEYRQIGFTGVETFRVFGTEGSFDDGRWVTKGEKIPLSMDEMCDPLPEDFLAEITKANPDGGAYGGHGGSHAYLVNEFIEAVAQDRHPAVNVWEAVRYMAPGAVAHKSAQRDGELLEVPDWGDPPKE